MFTQVFKGTNWSLNTDQINTMLRYGAKQDAVEAGEDATGLPDWSWKLFTMGGGGIGYCKAFLCLEENIFPEQENKDLFEYIWALQNEDEDDE